MIFAPSCTGVAAWRLRSSISPSGSEVLPYDQPPGVRLDQQVEFWEVGGATGIRCANAQQEGEHTLAGGLVGEGSAVVMDAEAPTRLVADGLPRLERRGVHVEVCADALLDARDTFAQLRGEPPLVRRLTGALGAVARAEPVGAAFEHLTAPPEGELEIVADPPRVAWEEPVVLPRDSGSRRAPRRGS